MFNTPTKNHFTIIFERLGAFGVLLVTLAYSFLFNGDSTKIFTAEYWQELWFNLLNSGNPFAVIGRLAVVVGAVIVLFVSIFAWRKTYFYIDGQTLVYEKRTIFKRISKLPIAQLATVNLERNVFERLVGTSKVKLDINSSVTANQTDFTFVLAREKAELFEKELLRIKELSYGCTEQKAASEPRERIVEFGRQSVIRHVLLSTPIVQLIFSIATVVGVAVTDGRIEIKQTLTAAGLLAGGYVISLVFQVLNAMFFVLEKDSKNLYISSGALRKKNYSFESEKINAVIVRQPLLARLFGLCSVDVAVVGLGNDKKELPQICLLSKPEEAQRIIESCAPDFVCTGEKIKSPKQGLFMSFLAALFISTVPCALLAVYAHFGYSLLLLAVAAVGAFCSYTAKTLRRDKNIFSYSRGVFGKKTGYLKYSDIQTAEFTTNLLIKKSGVGKIRLSILSAAAMQNHVTGYFPSEEYERLEKIMLAE